MVNIHLGQVNITVISFWFFICLYIQQLSDYRYKIVPECHHPRLEWNKGSVLPTGEGQKRGGGLSFFCFQKGGLLERSLKRKGDLTQKLQ